MVSALRLGHARRSSWFFRSRMAGDSFRGLPIGSIVIPFWDYLKDSKYEPQKGTTMESMGRFPP